MDQDDIMMSFDDWQSRLSLMASEVMAMAEEDGLHPLYEVMDLITDAVSKIDEVRPS